MNYRSVVLLGEAPQGGGRRREAPRLRRDRRARARRPQPRSPARPTTRSCARRSCSRCRSRRARPRCAPAARSTTRRTWTSPCGPASCRCASSPASPCRTPPRRPTCRCPWWSGDRPRALDGDGLAGAQHLVLALGRGAGHPARSAGPSAGSPWRISASDGQYWRMYALRTSSVRLGPVRCGVSELNTTAPPAATGAATDGVPSSRHSQPSGSM